jgi:ribosome-binding protein aMBF1 (putative translation factor)
MNGFHKREIDSPLFFLSQLQKLLNEQTNFQNFVEMNLTKKRGNEGLSDAKEFGSYLKQLRKAKGFRVRHLAESTGYSSAYLSNVENGNRGIPSSELIRKLSAALGVTHIGMMIKAGHVTEEEVLTMRSENGINETR